MSLNIFGVFEIPAFGARFVDQKMRGHSLSQRSEFFLSGCLATLLSTPCSAPFLGSADTTSRRAGPVGTGELQSQLKSEGPAKLNGPITATTGTRNGIS